MPPPVISIATGAILRLARDNRERVVQTGTQARILVELFTYSTFRSFSHQLLSRSEHSPDS
ncbi:MAG: hypothetical protein OEV70_13625 [Nitrospirota bacterium]|nr:hypothetical protein [Nitrospirota bacterium]